METTPLCTGAELEGAPYLGLVVALRLLVLVRVVAVVAAVVVAVVPALLLDSPEEPQPVATSSAQDARRAAMPVFIGHGPFSKCSRVRTIAYGGADGRRSAVRAASEPGRPARSA